MRFLKGIESIKDNCSIPQLLNMTMCSRLKRGERARCQNCCNQEGEYQLMNLAMAARDEFDGDTACSDALAEQWTRRADFNVNIATGTGK